jgi:hypothetical protein
VIISNIYGILVFGAALGVIQAAAAYNDLKGLAFFRSKLLTYIFAVTITGTALGFFFAWNYMFATGVVAGVQQTGLFIQSIVATIVFTLIVSSLINIGYRSPQHHSAPPTGLDALREKTFFRAMWERIIKRNND